MARILFSIKIFIIILLTFKLVYAADDNLTQLLEPNTGDAPKQSITDTASTTPTELANTTPKTDSVQLNVDDSQSNVASTTSSPVSETPTTPATNSNAADQPQLNVDSQTTTTQEGVAKQDDITISNQPQTEATNQVANPESTTQATTTQANSNANQNPTSPPKEEAAVLDAQSPSSAGSPIGREAPPIDLSLVTVEKPKDRNSKKLSYDKIQGVPADKTTIDNAPALSLSPVVINNATTGGFILTDLKGRTLYIRLDGKPTADTNWVPYLLDPTISWYLSPNSLYSAVAINGGKKQWTYRKKFLFYYNADNEPKTTNGYKVSIDYDIARP